MNYSISPSKLNTFHLHVTDGYNGYITKDKLIEAIRGETPWSAKMEFGGAFHAVIEHGAEKYFNSSTGLYHVQIEGVEENYILQPEEVQVAEDYRAKYKGMVNESKATYPIKIGDHNVIINMRIDGLWGNEVHERKTTDKSPKYENYADSIQWKCYALATECNKVVYDVFKYNNPRIGPKQIELVQFEFLPYPTMLDDIRHYVDRFVRFCENEDLMDFIKSKYQTEAV